MVATLLASSLTFFAPIPLPPPPFPLPPPHFPLRHVQQGATNVDYFGSSYSYNTTRWCLYETLSPLTGPVYNSAVCYCSYYPQPVPRGRPTFEDSCLSLEFHSGDPCNKIFTEFTPTLRASSTITALLTVLSFCLSIISCISLCCEVRAEELPVLPAVAVPGQRGVQMVQVGLGPPGHTYPTNYPTYPTDTAGGYADDGKVQQAFYIDANGAPIGFPTGTATASAVTVGGMGTGGGGGSGGGGGAWSNPGPTVVVAYALPSTGTSGSTHEPRTS